MTPYVHADIQQKEPSISYYTIFFIVVLEIKPLIQVTIDEDIRNVNTLLFGNDQLHLDSNGKFAAIVHDFFEPN